MQNQHVHNIPYTKNLIFFFSFKMFTSWSKLAAVSAGFKNDLNVDPMSHLAGATKKSLKLYMKIFINSLLWYLIWIYKLFLICWKEGGNRVTALDLSWETISISEMPAFGRFIQGPKINESDLISLQCADQKHTEKSPTSHSISEMLP